MNKVKVVSSMYPTSAAMLLYLVKDRMPFFRGLPSMIVPMNIGQVAVFLTKNVGVTRETTCLRKMQDI